MATENLYFQFHYDIVKSQRLFKRSEITVHAGRLRSPFAEAYEVPMTDVPPYDDGRFIKDEDFAVAVRNARLTI